MNITYRIDCQECAQQGVKSAYIGETHRAWIDRLAEHEKALRLMDATYATVKHLEEHHAENKIPNFTFKVLATHRTSPERQLKEAFAIAGASCSILMNKEGEWGVNLLPSMGTETLQDMGE